ncbi:hypothetical protein [Paucibacter sp. M5-1]|uniref:hypothetical protein n=1 Tax=Paucibacter sp. M5-1 TaxID=3015998 RepID=UPI0022B8F078|nr:hypothetical protein [Paucibacter sp. M5-1]MCZ7881235.1 hypothetical protein [Paucibacter sp. M5-1]
MDDPSAVEKYQMLVSQLQHEDNLANIRTHWALVIQGLLLTGAGAVLGPTPFSSLTEKSTPIMLVLASIGLLTAAAAAVGVRASEDQQEALCRWWREQPKNADQFPPLYDHLKRQWYWRASGYFGLVGLLWAIMIGVALCKHPK